MLHSIISWDCTYRNFYHLIDALAQQNFDKSQYEVIFVEQRTQEISDKFNHSQGLESLYDLYKKYKNHFNLKIDYLNDESDCIHVGRCNNAARSLSKGEIISRMDGDMLVENNFLKKLTNTFEKEESSVVNIHRKMCEYPIGVKSFLEWKKQNITFETCLNAVADKYWKLDKIAPNKGPLISAHNKYWAMTEGEDGTELFGTVLSMAGGDLVDRFEVATGNTAYAMENTFAIHPWHPKGGGLKRREVQSRKFFDLQLELRKWAKDNNEPSWKKRVEHSNKLAQKNRKLVNEILKISEGGTEDLNLYSMWERQSYVKEFQKRYYNRWYKHTPNKTYFDLFPF